MTYQECANANKNSIDISCYIQSMPPCQQPKLCTCICSLPAHAKKEPSKCFIFINKEVNVFSFLGFPYGSVERV